MFTLPGSDNLFCHATRRLGWPRVITRIIEFPGRRMAQFSLNNVHKRGLKHHHFISLDVGCQQETTSYFGRGGVSERKYLCAVPKHHYPLPRTDLDVVLGRVICVTTVDRQYTKIINDGLLTLFQAQFSINNVHKRGLKHHHFISFFLTLFQSSLFPVNRLDPTLRHGLAKSFVLIHPVYVFCFKVYY